jgi:hypothetical protein
MSVQKKFEVLLENKLNQLNCQGYTIFEKWELYCWFNKERITSAVWDDIKERWDDRCPDRALSILKCEDKFVVFIKDCIEDL